MRFIAAFRLAAPLLVTLAAGIADDAATAVARNYPSELSAFAARHHVDEEREQAFAEFDAHEQRYVYAVYGNGRIGAVALLARASDGTYTVVDTVVGKRMAGASPTATLIDVDHDGVPELEASFRLPRRGTTSLIALRKGKLVDISPTAPDGGPILCLPQFADVSGTGNLDLIVALPSKTGDTQYVDYSLRGGTYKAGPAIVCYTMIARTKGKPEIRSVTFAVAASDVGKRHRMIVINGYDASAEYRAAAGTIKLNGVEVSPPRDFSINRARWEIPVAVQTENSIAAQVDGRPGARIGIFIVRDSNSAP